MAVGLPGHFEAHCRSSNLQIAISGGLIIISTGPLKNKSSARNLFLLRRVRAKKAKNARYLSRFCRVRAVGGPGTRADVEGRDFVGASPPIALRGSTARHKAACAISVLPEGTLQPITALAALLPLGHATALCPHRDFVGASPPIALRGSAARHKAACAISAACGGLCQTKQKNRARASSARPFVLFGGGDEIRTRGTLTSTAV